MANWRINEIVPRALLVRQEVTQRCMKNPNRFIVAVGDAENRLDRQKSLQNLCSCDLEETSNHVNGQLVANKHNGANNTAKAIDGGSSRKNLLVKRVKPSVRTQYGLQLSCGVSLPSVTKSTNVEANMNRPDDFSTSLSTSSTEGHGGWTPWKSRGFCLKIVENRDCRNL